LADASNALTSSDETGSGFRVIRSPEWLASEMDAAKLWDGLETMPRQGKCGESAQE